MSALANPQMSMWEDDSEERWQAAGRVKPGRAVVSRAQRAAYVIARFAVPNCDHILICTVLYNFNVSYPVEVADLINLRPAPPGISAAPDRTFESCHSEVGAANGIQCCALCA